MISRPYKQRQAYAITPYGEIFGPDIGGGKGTGRVVTELGKGAIDVLQNDPEFIKLEKEGGVYGYLTAQWMKVQCIFGSCPDSVKVKQEAQKSGDIASAVRHRELQAVGQGGGPSSGLPHSSTLQVPKLTLGLGTLFGPAPTTKSRYPTKSGTSGNCSWDTKGGWCWKSTACGGSCRTCRTGVATTNITTGCSAARTYFLNNYRKCTSCAKSGSGSTVAPKTSTGCPYSGCTSLSRGSSCFYCRCQKLCQGKGGVKTVRSDGSCYCKGASSNIPTTTSKPIDKLTAGCSYSGCNSFTGMTRCRCRCSKKCGSRGVKTVTSNGSCYCKPAPTRSTGCSTYLKQRCGNFCAQRPGNPYLDSKCSCFCR